MNPLYPLIAYFVAVIAATALLSWWLGGDDDGSPA